MLVINSLPNTVSRILTSLGKQAFCKHCGEKAKMLVFSISYCLKTFSNLKEIKKSAILARHSSSSPGGPSPMAQKVSYRTWEQEVAGSIPTRRPILFPRIDDSHGDRIHYCLIAAHCFDNVYVGKQSVAWKEYCHGEENWWKELQESMDRCTGRRFISEI